MDSFIERALWLAVHATEKHWMPLTLDFLTPMAPEHIAFLIKRHGGKKVRDAAAALLKQSDLAPTVKAGLTLALAKEEQNNDGLTKEERLKLFNVGKHAEKLAALAKQTTASLKLRSAALAKLASIDAARAGQLAAAQLNTFSDLDSMRQWLAPILPVAAASKAMTAALKEKPPTPDAGKLVIRVLTSTGRNDPELTAALGQTTTVQPYDAGWVNTLAAEVKTRGNAEKGKAVYASALTNCAACHAIGKQGGTIGPELDAVGRGIPIELLIEAVAFPNRQIKEGYVATTVTTQDGRLMQGYKISDANGELQLRDLLGATVHKFQTKDLVSRSESGSLMPEGLIGLMTREELRDLIAYLTTLGR
jgi:putative heme-binding domain-containing protein